MLANKYHLPKQAQTRIQGILRESIEAEKQMTLVTSPRASPVHLPPDRTIEEVVTVVSNDRMTEHQEGRILYYIKVTSLFSPVLRFSGLEVHNFLTLSLAMYHI